MDRRLLRSSLGIAAAFAVLVVSPLSAQGDCRADSDSVALADKLLERAGEQFEGGERPPAAFALVRRAVEVAPLNHERLAIILQLAHFENRPDSAISWANLARQRWPTCVMSDSALVQAKALPPERRRN